MGIFSRFENRMEDGLEGAADKMFDAPISPVQISKKAERAMRREKMVGAGKQYAPTLYTVLVNPNDDQRLFGYYPTLAGETETYLGAKAAEEGLLMDGQPLVRFIVDDALKHGKFDVIAELVSAPIIAELRQEEMNRYGLGNAQGNRPQGSYTPQPHPTGRPQPVSAVRQQQQGYVPRQDAAHAAGTRAGHQQLPYVPEDEIDRSIDYGEYTFDSQDFDNYEQNGASPFTPSVVGRETYGKRVSQPFEPAYAGGPDQAPHEDFSGIDIDTYDPYSENGFSIPKPPIAAPPAGNGGFQGAPAPMAAANTTVFAAGMGNANPVPSQQAVRARLVDVSTNRTIDLASNRLIMGRSSTSDVVLDDINASRSHAELRFEPQGIWTITDLGSTNGTLVNGQRITSKTLAEGDRISIGMTDFVFTQR